MNTHVSIKESYGETIMHHSRAYAKMNKAYDTCINNTGDIAHQAYKQYRRYARALGFRVNARLIIELHYTLDCKPRWE